MNMLDNDNLTYSYQKKSAALPANLSERAMICVERSQKLDLLVHLLANLQQSLIVCGPEGIGKTTLLQTLQDNRKNTWPICFLHGASDLSFESIVNQLNHFLNPIQTTTDFDLASLRAVCEKHKVVLIIDDAGQLMPGLIGELVAFADSLAGLRLVFSMTYDDFHIKSATDKAVDDCHFIELPPLSQKQCRQYLQNLSAQPNATLSFNAITDSLVEDLYRETHGIPGKILAELPKLSQKNQGKQPSKLGLWIGVALVVGATGFTVYSLLPAQKLNDSNVAQTVVAPPAPNIEQPPIAQDITAPASSIPAFDTITPLVPANDSPPTPQPSTIPLDKPRAVETLPEKSAATASILVAEEKSPPSQDKSPITSSAPDANAQPEPQASPPPATEPKTTLNAEQPARPAPETKPLLASEKKPGESKPAKAGDEDNHWILSQPPGNFTLQVMVLSNKASAKNFLKKYADYRDSLTYYTITANGQEKYVILYGSFTSAAEATQYKTLMPSEFKQALEVRFKNVQKAIRH